MYSFQMTWDIAPSDHMLRFKANQNKCQGTEIIPTVLFDRCEVTLEVNNE